MKAPLTPWLSSASIVLTSHDVKTLYYLDRYDVVISANRISEIRGAVEGDAELGIDVRTGRPVINTPESLRLFMACYPDGLILAEAGHIRSDEACPSG